MSTHWRLKCSFQLDTAFPRDRVEFNPCFRIQSAISDVDALCEDLATALDGWITKPGAPPEISVKGYDIEGTKPVYPSGVAVRNAGGMGTSTVPREIALCLSFYADTNAPRRRGRLYVPLSLMVASAAAPKVPTSGHQASVEQLVPIFSSLGGVDVDWIVWSKRDHAAHKVTNYWIDNEWDIQRRRGLKPTSRLQASTSG